MKYAIKLLYDNGQSAYLDVKGRHTWKTKRAAQKHYDVCMALFNKGRFFNGVVEISIDRGFFA
jgi:hypothetical protein